MHNVPPSVIPFQHSNIIWEKTHGRRKVEKFNLNKISLGWTNMALPIQRNCRECHKDILKSPGFQWFGWGYIGISPYLFVDG